MAFGIKHFYQFPEGDAAPAAAPAANPAANAAPAAAPAPSDGTQKEPSSAPTEPRWPEQWREMYAKGADGKVDEAKLAHLKRFSDPNAALDSFVQLRQKISAGELRAPLPKDATPEAIAEYRKTNGIPEEPGKYELKLREGLNIGAEDKPFVDKFLSKVHGKHVTNEQASAFVEAYYDIITEQQKAGAEARAKQEQQVTDALNTKWGADYRPNINRISSMLDGRVADPKLRELIDGAMKTNQPFAELLEGLAREINPASTILPEGVTADVGNIESEIKKIEDVIRNKRDEYNRDEKMQARYLQLLGARDAMQKKAA